MELTRKENVKALYIKQERNYVLVAEKLMANGELFKYEC